MCLLKRLCFCKAETAVFYRRKTSAKFQKSKREILKDFCCASIVMKINTQASDGEADSSPPSATITLLLVAGNLQRITLLSLEQSEPCISRIPLLCKTHNGKRKLQEMMAN